MTEESYGKLSGDEARGNPASLYVPQQDVDELDVLPPSSSDGGRQGMRLPLAGMLRQWLAEAGGSGLEKQLLGWGPQREKWRLGGQWDRGSIHRSWELGICQGVAVTDRQKQEEESFREQIVNSNKILDRSTNKFWGLLVLSQVVLAYQKSD